MSYSHKFALLISEMTADLSAVLSKGAFNKEVDDENCHVELLNVDDSPRIWIEWGRYDCPFINLPNTPMAVIADMILA